MTRLLVPALCVVSIVGSGCGGCGKLPPGGDDSGVEEISDGGTQDGGNPADAGQPDAGVFDSGTSDAGVFDSGTSDAGAADSGAPDSGVSDAGPGDGGQWTWDGGTIHYVKASNAEASDNFGYAISLSGDTLAVGAFGERSNATGVNGNESSNSASGAGAVYVFVRDGGAWNQEAYLKPSNTGLNFAFGDSLSLWGDTLAVGAWGERSGATGVNGNQSDTSAVNAGAVYVFTRSGTTWSQQAYLKASNTGAQDEFGRAVSLFGDTLAVGAAREDSSAQGVGGDQNNNDAGESGAVYVFARSGTSWSQQAYLKASNAEGGDVFGTSVSVSGDTLVVGAVGEDSFAEGVNGVQSDNSKAVSGAAYVFTRSAGVWAQQAYLKASVSAAGAQFGRSVSASGDAIAVGAPYESSSSTGINGNPVDTSAPQAGAVYVFARDSLLVWSQQAYVKASNTEARDYFGNAVSLFGDLLAVGAYGEDSASLGVDGVQGDNGALESGAVYLFGKSGGLWGQRAYLKASNTEAGDYFGISVSLSGNSVAGGAQFEASNATGVGGNQTDNSAPGAGAVYVY